MTFFKHWKNGFFYVGPDWHVGPDIYTARLCWNDIANITGATLSLGANRFADELELVWGRTVYGRAVFHLRRHKMHWREFGRLA